MDHDGQKHKIKIIYCGQVRFRLLFKTGFLEVPRHPDFLELGGGGVPPRAAQIAFFLGVCIKTVKKIPAAPRFLAILRPRVAGAQPGGPKMKKNPGPVRLGG